MKLFTLLTLLVAPFAAMNAQQDAPAAPHAYKEINAEQLKSWIDQKKNIVVLDARGKVYFDGSVLPTAKWIKHDSTDAEIQAVIPSKDSIVIVYCAGKDCPASGWLADRLCKMGYTNVYEYPEGLQGWKQKGYPVEKQ